jgi:hypothetical protein
MRGATIVVSGVIALVCLMVSPNAARGQSAFTGVARDSTGAILPGVTVEASSPVLIEKVRTAITDERGSYRIPDLRPGTYVLEFSLPGFSTFKREIELQSNFTATVNVELEVGTVTETLTVSAERLLVTDIENNQKIQILPREVLDSVPTAHTIQSVGQLITGVTLSAPDVAGSRAMQQTYFSVHGAGAAQTTVLMDGMIINGLQGDGAIQSYGNDAGNQEMVYQTGGGTVDSPTGGLKISMVPKEGGNEFHGSLFAGYEGSRLQSNNLSPFLVSHGVKAVDKIGMYRDINATFGGRIIRDKLWFFTSMRLFSVHSPVANTFYVPKGQTYANCLSGVISCVQGVNKEKINSGLLRLTWQVNARNKLSAYIDRLFKTRDRAMTPGDDPETASVVWGSPLYMTNTIKWTSTVTNRLLIQGGYSSNIERYTNQYQPGIEKKWGTPEWYAGAHRVDTILGTRWNAAPIEYFSYPDRYNVQGSVSYVTGPHNMKFGFQDSWGPYNQAAFANADLYQNYMNAVPATVTLRVSPIRWQDRLNANLGIFAQDAWTIKRVTINYGLRWEYVREQVTGQPAQSGRFAKIPAYETFRLPIWRTWSPRVSIVYDLFGNTKTAVRAGYNKFAAAATTTFAGLYNPGNAIGSTASAAWTDLNQDDIAQGELGCTYLTPGCEINFANVPRNFGVISLASPDPKLKRAYYDSYNVGFTHEILKGVAVSGEWFHNEGRNIVVRNNILRPGTFTAPDTVTNSNYRAVTVFSPIDGKAITMYDPVSAAVQQAVANVDTNEPRLRQKYNSYEFNLNARFRNGVNLFGGSATERTVANVCAAALTNPNILNYCDQSKSGIPWRTQFKLAGTYPLPWWGFQLSGALQALPGYILGTQALTQGGAGAPNLTAVNGQGTIFAVTPTTRYTVCPGDSAAAGCRVGDLVVPAMNQASINVPLVAPGTELTPRITQVDFSIAKRLAFERIRFSPKIDIFNAFNSSAYYSVRSLTYSTASGATYKLPENILRGRILRLAIVVDF